MPNEPVPNEPVPNEPASNRPVPNEPVPNRAESRPPPAFVISASCGLIGLVLLVLGLTTDAEALYLAGVAAGVVSLIAALVWREELIMAWNAQRKRRQSP